MLNYRWNSHGSYLKEKNTTTKFASKYTFNKSYFFQNLIYFHLMKYVNKYVKKCNRYLAKFVQTVTIATTTNVLDCVTVSTVTDLLIFVLSASLLVFFYTVPLYVLAEVPVPCGTTAVHLLPR